MTILKYKDYVGSAEVSVEDGVVFGKLLHVKALVTYESENVSDIQVQFEAAVDDYFDDCRDAGLTPDVPFKEPYVANADNS